MAPSGAMPLYFEKEPMKIQKIVADTVHILRDNAPLILTATAVAGVVSTTVLAVKATPRAMRDIWDAEQDIVASNDERTKSQVALDRTKVTWKLYLPAALSGAATITAIVAAHTTHTKRHAALVGLYALSERTFHEYRDSVEEIAEGKVVDKIKERVAEKKIEEAPEETLASIDPDEGEVLCYDAFSGRYFKSNTEEIKAAANNVNHTIINHMYASLNDFYVQLGLDTVKLGEDVGWNSDHLIEVTLTSVLTQTGKPSVYLDFANRPYPGYHKFN